MTATALTALLVDDVADLRRLYRMILERSGRFVVVAEAADGVDAVSLARQHRPQLVVLDVSMPRLDGLEALPQILRASPGSRVVMLSGFNGDRLAGTALQRGAVRYLEKGLTPDQLVTELLAAMGEPHEPGSWQADVPVRGDTSAEDTMLSVVSHEIRGPLAVVHGYAATLEDEWDDFDPVEARRIVGRIASNTRYLDGVVRSLLTLRTLEAGDALLDLTEWDPVELLEELLRVTREEHRERQIDLEVVGRPAPVRIDAERFRQVVSNLVGNADRYSPPGEPITVTLQPDGDATIVSVTDQGPGIPEEDRHRVFDRFVRLQQGGSGVGLGLYISRLLMDAMGGEIWIGDSTGGTRICCRLVGSPIEVVTDARGRG